MLTIRVRTFLTFTIWSSMTNGTTKHIIVPKSTISTPATMNPIATLGRLIAILTGCQWVFVALFCPCPHFLSVKINGVSLMTPPESRHETKLIIKRIFLWDPCGSLISLIGVVVTCFYCRCICAVWHAYRGFWEIEFPLSISGWERKPSFFPDMPCDSLRIFLFPCFHRNEGHK